MPETAAITFSLFLVVIISVVLGACLPLGLKKIGVDPAHSSTSIQVGEGGAARTRAGRPRLPR